MIINEGVLNGDGVELLKILDSNKDTLSNDSLACLPAVILCSPPFLDFEEAWKRLSKLWNGAHNTSALVWLSYIYTNYLPLDFDFMQAYRMIDKLSSEHLYMMADIERFSDNLLDAYKYAKMSIELRKFPNNLMLFSDLVENPKSYIDESISLINVKPLEEFNAKSIEELYTNNWRQSITGEDQTIQAFRVILSNHLP